MTIATLEKMLKPLEAPESGIRVRLAIRFTLELLCYRPTRRFTPIARRDGWSRGSGPLLALKKTKTR